jgi:hypothetical protein
MFRQSHHRWAHGVSRAKVGQPKKPPSTRETIFLTGFERRENHPDIVSYRAKIRSLVLENPNLNSALLHQIG